MPDTHQKAIALLIYSTAGPQLLNLQAEVEAIHAHLSNYCEVVVVPAATLDTVMAAVISEANSNRIVIVHYAGHANGEGILLGDGKQPHGALAHVQGLARILESQRNLRIVFINGCASRDQVLELTKAGIPLVIATTRGIDDSVARKFATQLYAAIKQIKPIGEAFRLAEGNVQGSVGANARAVYFGEHSKSAAAQQNEWPWELHGSHADREWTLKQPFSRPNPRWDPRNVPLNEQTPYLGVKCFEESDAGCFFGRDALIAELLQASASAPLLLVVGSSGSGKSSVVRAGLIPAWKKQAQGKKQPREFVVVPQDNPFEQLCRALDSKQSFDSDKISSLRNPSPTALHDSISVFNKGEPWLIFIDQFEQVFTRTDNADIRRLFLQSIADLASRRPPNVCLVVAMRDDFFPQLRDFPELCPLTDKNFHRVAALDRQALEEAIQRPAAAHGVDFEPGLVGDIVESVIGRPGALPLLQYGLDKLWEKDDLQDRMLNWTSYNDIGGVTGSLRARLEVLYNNQKTDAAKNEFRWMMLKLVKFEDGEAGTTAVSRIAQKSEFQGKQQELLDTLIDAEKLVVSAPTDVPSVQLGHEAIIAAWQTFNTWTAEIQEASRLRQQLGPHSRAWIESQKDPKMLWQGAQLLKALELRENGDFARLGGLNPDEGAFLVSSREQSEQLTQQLRESNYRLQDSNRRLQRSIHWTLGVAVVALLSACGSGWYYRQAHLAKIEALHNLAVSDLANAAPAIREHRIADALHWYSAAITNSRSGQVTNNSAMSLFGAWSASLHATVVHDEAVVAVAFSPDGLTVVTGSYDNTARLWDARTGKPQGEPLKHDDAVNAVAFSPNGKTVLTGSDDKTARLWDAQTGKPSGEPLKHEGRVAVVAFSPDGKTVLTGSDDKTARLWDAQTSKPSGEPLKHEGRVAVVAFSPDGKTVLTGSDDKTARLWDAQTGKPSGEPLKHEGKVAVVAFSPDGKTILTGCNKKKAYLWNAKNVQNPIVLEHRGQVHAAAFSPNGNQVLTAAWQNEAVLWDVINGMQRCTLPHDDIVESVAYRGDGRAVVTGSRDGSARVWDPELGTPLSAPLKHDGFVWKVAFSPQGQVATGSNDNTARLWNVRAVQDLAVEQKVCAADFHPNGTMVLAGSRDNVARLWKVGSNSAIDSTTTQFKGESLILSVAFSPKGDQIVTGDDYGNLQLWSIDGKPVWREPCRCRGNIWAVAFSRDGETILSGASGGNAQLWDVKRRSHYDKTFVHEPQSTEVRTVAFGQDDKFILTGGTDAQVQLWDVSTGKRTSLLLKHEDLVNSVAFSPCGKRILTGCRDKKARLWNASTGERLGTPITHKDSVFSVAFSRDGLMFVTASLDGIVQLWDVHTLQPYGEPIWHSNKASAVALSPDGKNVLTGGDNGARFWNIPLSVAAPDTTRRLSVEVQTGLEFDESSGAITPLKQADWLKRQKRLWNGGDQQPQAKP